MQNTVPETDMIPETALKPGMTRPNTTGIGINESITVLAFI